MRAFQLKRPLQGMVILFLLTGLSPDLPEPDSPDTEGHLVRHILEVPQRGVLPVILLGEEHRIHNRSSHPLPELEAVVHLE